MIKFIHYTVNNQWNTIFVILYSTQLSHILGTMGADAEDTCKNEMLLTGLASIRTETCEADILLKIARYSRVRPI